jgi:hypothetical protein
MKIGVEATGTPRRLTKKKEPKMSYVSSMKADKELLDREELTRRLREKCNDCKLSLATCFEISREYYLPLSRKR